ncbi:TyrS-associated PheT N-terminal domain-related protein TapR [Mycoplasma tauri]|uniref:tRNA-binding protein n=1 Tax=Mycoplasma tauri TaxID=547987 RepID=A0A953T3L5_9MOLU|nr:tRNA-binding protein [Mycoplasma tauri]MBZ4195208.1 tRNA-binding protein [Mycoplasma tauri]MBZ4217979.1 tRNA-binding protein [Mycoplasma tauri]MBZ4226543.1 tRNA-binding protein [Mycoplasma tauri]
MALFFNIDNNFKEAKIIFFDSRVQGIKFDVYDDFTVIRDENFNVASINIFSNVIKKENKNFGYLTANENNKLKEKILSKNSKYKFTEINYFLVGKITKRESHPKSDKLFVLLVDFGAETKQIITNTLYTTVGKYFVWCQPGSITASGLEIVESEIMGEKSYGMLCSSDSLGLSTGEKEKLDVFLNNANDNYLGKEIFELLDFD